MDDLENLELLSLVSKVSSELQNHLGISDKTLAEFIIEQHVESQDSQDFQKKIGAFGVPFPQSLVDSIDRLVLTMHPTKKKARETEERMDAPSGDVDKKARLFRGLAIPDREVEVGVREQEESGLGGLDDTFAQLEALAGPGPMANGNGTSRKRSRSPYGKDRDRHSKRYRGGSGSRSRSRSPRGERRRQRNDQYTFEDEEGYAQRSSRTGRNGHKETRRRRRSSSEPLTKPPVLELDDQPELYKVYLGRVTGVKDFGAFVNLQGVRGKVDGLVHVSQFRDGRVNHPSDLVSVGQEVKVKVLKNENNRVSLSMKEVDQVTGEDMAPQRRLGTGANNIRLGRGAADGLDNDFDGFDGNDGVKVVEDGYDAKKHGKVRKRLTSPERWEIKQLIASGAISRDQYPDIDEYDNHHVNDQGEIEEEEDIDIEVREEEPAFLQGQTKASLELSPIRIVRAPDGSMNRAAISSEQNAKERNELRRQEAADKAAAGTVDVQSSWQDPMAEGGRKFANELRQARINASEGPMPEWKKIATGQERELGRRTNMSIKDQRESLPVYKFRSQLIKAVQENQILIVVGDTGSGKTTQLTQYLAEAGMANEGIIGCTQPRRVAAMSVAQRVADEVGTKLGDLVGYTIRFEDMTSPNTRIKYMTDGIMQREILLDPMLSKYSVIMLDEAHERTIATDTLFGLIKKALKRRPDLKLIVTSATLDADKFSKYFNSCPIFSIPGRTFPVEILYAKEPVSDYLDETLTTVMQIHLMEPPGDILVFLTGKEEIDTSCEILTERMKALGPSVPALNCYPAYGALPSETASRIFEPSPPGERKVVIATNIAETSITIDGIYYVIDPGFVKQSAYDPKLGMDRLQVTPVSQAQAKQRSGRAGRTGPGKCFRLYTESAFQSEMLPTTIPEIQRTNLASTILTLKAMGINDLLHFDFMDPPPTNTMLTALEELYQLGALDEEGLLTRQGRQMADFPMDPSLAKTLIASAKFDCADEMLTIVSMITGAQTIFHRPKDKQQQADQKKAKFHDQHGDHLTLLNVYNAWKRAGYSKPFCLENFVQPRNMARVRDVRQQLSQIFARHKLPQVSCGRNTIRVRQALCTGFFRNAARKAQEGNYTTLVENTPVYLHPSSALFGKPADMVVYHSLVETTKEYMHNVTTVEAKWLVDAAPTFFRVATNAADGSRMSRRKRDERIVPLQLGRGQGDDEWRLSAQRGRGRGGGGTWG